MVGAYPDTALAQFAYFASEGKPASGQGKDAPAAAAAPSTQVTPVKLE
jgi:hypothetical protein